jgi:hypothetical protein
LQQETQQLEELARDANQIAELARQAMENFLAIDETVWKNANRLAAGLGVKPMDVINRMTIRGFAENAAQTQVHGRPLPDISQALFMWEGEGSKKNLMAGNDLFQNLKEHFVRDLEDKREREIRSFLERSGDRKDLLSDEDRDFIDKRWSKK